MAKFLILADYPAFDDPEKNLKDPHGRYFWHLMFTSKVPMADMAIEFLYDGRREMFAGLSNWRGIEAKHKPEVILCLGQKAFGDIGFEGKVSKVRGSVFTLERRTRKTYVIPTYNVRDLKDPERVFAEESMAKGVICMADIQRAVRVYNNGYEQPAERFNLDPTVEEVEAFVEEAIEKQWLLGADIEATGLNIEYAKIVVLGFAWSESDAIVIPFLKEHGADYYKPRDWNRIKNALKRLMKRGRFMFQNGVGYDVPLLRQRGWKFDPETMVVDTMVQHHLLDPESPHNIGFISSIFGKQPYWKDVMSDFWGEKIFTADQTEMKKYNARDCVALHQIHNGMNDYQNELIESDPIFKDLPFVLTKSMAEAQAVVRMEESGMFINMTRYSKWIKFLEKEINEVEDRIRGMYDLPGGFSLSSPHHKRMWLYGEKIKSLDPEKLSAQLALYEVAKRNYQFQCVIHPKRARVKGFYDTDDIPKTMAFKCPDCGKERSFNRTNKEPTMLKGKSKDTEAYRTLKAKYDISQVEPLYHLTGYKPLKTKTKGVKDPMSALDKAAMVRYMIHINERLDKIDNLVRRQEKHDIEEKELIKLRGTINDLKTYGKYKKLQDSFTSKLLEKRRSNGKIYPHFMVTGAATGRLSCKNPNAQQIPSGKIGEIIRGCFQAGKGNEFMSVDWSNLEVWIGAYFMEDTALIDILNDGVNFHDFNTTVFFGLTAPTKDEVAAVKAETSPPETVEKVANWTRWRKLAKIIVFARIMYGGTDSGIYTQIMSADPDCGLTLKGFKKAIANYMKQHPDYVAWCKTVQELAYTKRLSVNAFGRVRILMGEENKIMRQALNSPVQGSAADVARACMPKFYEYIDNKGWADRVNLVLQVHDEYLIEYPIEMRHEVGLMCQEVMCSALTIKGRTFNLKIDAEVGKYWGGMDGYDIDKDIVEKGSKH